MLPRQKQKTTGILIFCCFFIISVMEQTINKAGRELLVFPYLLPRLYLSKNELLITFSANELSSCIGSQEKCGRELHG